VSFLSRAVRIGVLMAAAGALTYWSAHHAEVTFADGLRYVHEAQRIESGDYAGGILRATDHPVHPLAIAAAHRLLDPDPGPYAWQAAAQAAAAVALVLAVVPLYLLGRDLFEDEGTAWLGCVLVMANPVIAYIAVNVLSESTFLLFWLWGLWASVRFLREGRFRWLPPAIACGALAYLTRPEGMLLHLALVATLLVLPLHRLTRINWPRWRAAVALLVLGPAALVGPYVAVKGGLGTKPAVARVIGTMPQSPPAALERERPLPPDQTAVQTYALATARAFRALRGVVTWPWVPLAGIGLVVAARGMKPDRARAGLLLGVIVAGSLAGLVRLHATGGYCTVRHALVPGVIFLLAAAHGWTWVMRNLAFDGARLGLGPGRLRPGPAVYAAVIGGVLAWPYYQAMTPFTSSFAAYRMAGSWLSDRPNAGDGRVVDLTDWSLFFANRPGYGIGQVDEAAARLETRFVVVREAHLTGHGRSSEIARSLVDGRAPILRFPEHPGPHQIQVMVYDLTTRPGAALTKTVHRGGRGEEKETNRR
jgi:hypothetical protein